MMFIRKVLFPVVNDPSLRSSNLSLSPFLFTLSSFPLARLRCAPYANGVIYISKW